MIYLDSAATTLQKPPKVARACAYAVGNLASPGRGGHRAAMGAGQVVFQCRQQAASLFSMENPEQVVFTLNATHGLNIAIKSLVKPGDRVLISGYEHNAVTRVLYAIPNLTVKIASSPLFDQKRMLEAVERNLTEGVNAVVCTHVSNVFGYVLPIEDIAKACQRHQVPLIVDASQSAGCIPIDAGALSAAFVAMPGHKGLYGPQGTGLLLCGQEAVPLLQGGTGSNSKDQTMPDFLPDRLEAGTLNVTGIAGLLEGLRFVAQKGVSTIRNHEEALVRRMGRAFEGMPKVKAFWNGGQPGTQAGVLSFQVEGWDCEELAQKLGAMGFALRAGLHCAPLAHQTVGTLEEGTVRASVSAFNTPQEINRFVDSVRRVVARG